MATEASNQQNALMTNDLQYNNATLSTVYGGVEMPSFFQLIRSSVCLGQCQVTAAQRASTEKTCPPVVKATVVLPMQSEEMQKASSTPMKTP
jgi:hypothetical protein